jgi:hypothetical protein
MTSISFRLFRLCRVANRKLQIKFLRINGRYTNMEIYIFLLQISVLREES